VGGVFLRLFIANPGWVLRKPKEFLTELLEIWSKLVALDKPDVSQKLSVFERFNWIINHTKILFIFLIPLKI
jgi:DnaJ family protein C protein 13